MRLTQFDAKNNVLYINSNVILPKTEGLPFREHCKMYKEAFKKSYQQRLEDYASEDQRQSVLKDIEDHPGCDLSEFSSI